MAYAGALQEDHIVDGAFLDHYRCPEEFAAFSLTEHLSKDCGFFRFGPNVVCYGRSSSQTRAVRASDRMHDVMDDIAYEGRSVRLPFRPLEVVRDLRHERYVADANSQVRPAVASAYYLARPFLGIWFRKHLQRARLRGWHQISFPKWPVDSTVEQIFENLLQLSLKAHGVSSIPFVWFWPDGFESCVMMTHDVETSAGRDFVPHLMDLDDKWEIKSSFQVIPEGRYELTKGFLNAIRERGFEINVHDLNHDGRLFSDRERFVRRAEQINRYGKIFGAEGFRSAILYRNLDWLATLDFRYDMSVPSIGHLEAQRGGCCSIMPFFNGHMVELPVTTTQDYSLFQILKQRSIDLWKRQLSLIGSKHGLATFIVHPDYIVEARPRKTYTALLDHLKEVRTQGRSWMALPRDVYRWWRDRSRMRLTRHGHEWKVEGPGSHRARVAHASLGERGVVYRLQSAVWTFTTEEPFVGLVAAALLACVVLGFLTPLLAPAVTLWMQRAGRTGGTALQSLTASRVGNSA